LYKNFHGYLLIETDSILIPLIQKKLSKMNNNYNQIGFALEILRILSRESLSRDALSDQLADFLEKRGKSERDVPQKLTRMISKLRDCGFEIRSAPNRPYELVESAFPLILSQEQRQSLALASYVLDGLGFSAQASQIQRLGQIKFTDLPPHVKVNFSPPADYSDEHFASIVQTLQERFSQQCRYSIRYRGASGKETNWDCDRSELRIINGVLYLFAYVPDFKPKVPSNSPHFMQNMAFRVDRIISVRPASDTAWFQRQFPKQTIRYRMSGPLRTYQPRRANEREIARNDNYVEIETTEDYYFGIRQRILQYGSNIQVLSPDWFAQEIREEWQRAATQVQDIV
jgi:predicted DNA-binding transcriptional regulator YafY